MAKIETIRKKIIPVLEKYGVTKASLFGSFARGEEKRNSDIDLLVEMPLDASLFTIVALKRDLEKKVRRIVDILTYNSVHRFIKKYVNKYAIKIYDKRR